MTFEGTMVADPELRFTPSGKAVGNFRVVANDRKRDAAGTWQDADPLFLTVTVWEQLAENVVESCKKGDPVIVIGKLRQREWETREGEKRTDHEIVATNVALALRFRTARSERTGRTPVKAAESGADVWAGQPDEPPY